MATQKSLEMQLPLVSLVVAARNEAENLPALLTSIDGLSYPKDRLQLLIGDDGSTDGSDAILAAWALERPWAEVMRIEHHIGILTGKANVLAQLCRRAKGEFFLFTDADCTLPEHWIEKMRAGFGDESVGVVTGITLPEYHDFSARMQACDWGTATTALWWLSLVGIPVTSMGNNMAIKREAYSKAGGFDAVGHTIVEDYAIYKRILAEGYGFRQLYHRDVLAITRPMSDSASFREQRKRWLKGAFQLPIWIQLPFWVQMAWYPALALLAVAGYGDIALEMAWGKLLGQTLCIAACLARLGQWRLIPWLIPYEFWAARMAWRLMIHYHQSPEVTWKGRRYMLGRAEV